ncbi:MAG: Rpn family recombination-promoting nuclease/putative transposase [Candidatus Riflebacteria bacterium]|nr:Rpn family recombination-promoting nuclease/putative transposase [Candidatus Riflebacteria bacterium]
MSDNQKVYGLTNDFLFKAVFGQEANKKLTIYLLNALLQLEGQKQIKEIEIINPFNAQNYQEDKLSILDTRVKDVAGKCYNIEMQVKNEEDFIKRFSYYLSKLYSSQLHKNAPYSELQPAIGIAILGYDLFPQSYRIDEQFIFKNQENDIMLDEVMIMHFIGLTKLSHNKPIKNMSRFEKWVYLLYNSKKYASKNSKIPSEMESEPGMTEVVDCVKKSNSDKEMRARMEDRENSLIYLSLIRGNGYRKGKEDGIEEGKKEGIKEGMKNIINTMLSNGTPKATILKQLNITDEEYEKLLN